EIPPPDVHDGRAEQQPAGERHLLRGPEREAAARSLLRALALDRQQVDANHRSPAFRSARPTATATVGTRLSAPCTPSLSGSKPIFLNGSNASTGVPKRSCSACAKPSTFDAPPLRRIRSIRSEDAVALKKSNVFWISRRTFSVTACSTGRTSSYDAPSTGMPFFSCSALSNDRFSSFWTASV